MKPYRLPVLIHTLILLGVLAGSHLAQADDLPLTDTAAGVQEEVAGNTQTEAAAADNTQAETSDGASADTSDTAPDPADPNALPAAPPHEPKIEKSMANIELIQNTLESMRAEIESSRENANLNRTSVKTIRDGLELIDSKLKEAYNGLDASRSSIAANTEALEKMKKDVMTMSRDLRATTADSESQKSLIEENSIRLYEILLQITAISDKINLFADTLAGKTGQAKDMQLAINGDLNRLWMLLSIVLVFFAPVAFILSGLGNKEASKLLTDGAGQQQGMVLACLGVFLGYFLLGFGLMYGNSASGWIGTSSYLLQDIASTPGTQPLFSFTEFVMYQTGFAMMSALIVYVAVGHRISSTAHMMLALFVGAVLMPVFGHWAWAGYFIPNNNGWLQGAGFIDQAGSTTINSVSAWFALVIVWKMGRQQPDYDDPGQDEPVYSSSATQLLWLSWLGFTTGTLPISSEQIPSVMLNTGLAASAGGMTAFLHYVFFHTDQGRISRGLSGFVSGLVAIAACAQSVTFAEALAIGALAGLLQNIAFKLLRKSFLKQGWQIPAAYLVAIHGVGGVWGTLCVALFGTEDNFSLPSFIQLTTQFQGVAAAMVYSFLLGNVIATLLFLTDKKQKTAQPPAVLG